MPKCAVLLCALVVGLLVFSNSHAEVEMKLFRSYPTTEAPRDVAVSKNGKWVYVLTGNGTVNVYTLDGDLKDQISVGPGVDRIETGLRDDILFLSSEKDRSVRMMLLEFIHDIDVSGSPFKGPVDAPVTIAVFSDFQ